MKFDEKFMASYWRGDYFAVRWMDLAAFQTVGNEFLEARQ
jgi:hypothetical protein